MSNLSSFSSRLLPFIIRTNHLSSGGSGIFFAACSPNTDGSARCCYMKGFFYATCNAVLMGTFSL